MPPIPIYNNSPVAAKPEGVTPQTAGGGGGEKAAGAPTTAAATTTGATYPRAQPGAAPALPVPTGAAQAPTSAAPLQPTATQPLRSREGPPPPQPGAVPHTPTRTGGSSLPPPPKAGEKFVPPPPATTSAVPVPYPQQMSISPPTMAYPAQQHGTATATAPPSFYGQTSGTTGSGSISSSSSNNHRLDHPPGYHQNANASELDQYHQQASLGRNDSAGAQADAAGEEGLWGAAKKLAQGAGEKLVTAESEVWKRINKQ